MNTLESAVHEALGEIPKALISAMIENKLAAQGVKLSERQLRRLRERVLESDGG